MQSNNKIVGAIAVGGYVGTDGPYNLLFRLKQNGTIDSSFGENGFISIAHRPYFSEAMKILPDNKILIFGLKLGELSSISDLYLAVFDKNGKFLDSALLKAGDNWHPEDVSKIKFELDKSGNIVVSFKTYIYKNSIFTPQLIVCRITPDGKYDPTFNNGQPKSITYPDDYRVDVSTALAIQNDNKIIIGSPVFIPRDKFAIQRLNTNGTVDLSFGNAGVASVSFEDSIGGFIELNDIKIQPDNKILLLGTTSAAKHTKYQFALARFNSNGTADTSFGTNGKTVTGFRQNKGDFRINRGIQMALQNNGKIVTVGYSEYALAQLEGNSLMACYLPEKKLNNAAKQQPLYSTNLFNGITISPNPVKDILNISSKNLSYKNISVIDASGKVVLKDGFAGSNHAINMNGLSAGIYYVQVMHDSKRETVKFVKQ